MEQLYLVEIFIDKVSIYVSEDEENSGANKNLIVKIKFGPKMQFIIKEGQLAPNNEKKDDMIECDDSGKRKWSRTIRVGKSYIFPSYPDTVLMILSKFPLELEVWNDDESEIDIFVGIGTMQWDTKFFHMLKETAVPCKRIEPLSLKQTAILYAECCCKRVGEVDFIVRLTALGETIVTEFQQLMQDPEAFVFRTDKAPSMFKCTRVEGDDPNFCMVGSLYETTTLEDPDVVNAAQNKIEVCTELQSCAVSQKADESCRTVSKEETKKRYPISKIKMGDITGPCGNTNCPLAHKVRNYIRNLDTYKEAAAGKVSSTKDDATRKICGACSCKDEKWHRDECPDKFEEPKEVCQSCGGLAKQGDTCEDRKNKMYGTGATPRGGSPTNVAYLYSVPNFMDSIYGQNYTVQNVTIQKQPAVTSALTQMKTFGGGGCCCTKPQDLAQSQPSKPITDIFPKPPAYAKSALNTTTIVYNATVSEMKGDKQGETHFCLDIPDDKDCKCSPVKPPPPCKTTDCDCIAEAGNIAARKAHKPHCPLYKHKSNCPVTMMSEEEELQKKGEDYEDETEPLPYGLPPIKLGPCPILGRPCTVPDGFARMYRTAALPAQPPSWSDAGKVCCSKEYERIKKAIKEYMTYEKGHDFKCINTFNVDTERRCCDKEQRLFALMGKGCCGAHKLAIQEKFKEEKK